MLPHGFEIDPAWRYMTALPWQNVPAYQTADAHLAWKFTRQFELSADGRNLLQPSHTEFGGDNDMANSGIRRSNFGGITLTH